MGRQRRFTIDNATYHVFSRGHNKQTIFHQEEDFEKYLKLLAENKQKYNTKIYHYVLMNNHTHLIIYTEEGEDLSNFMRNLNQSYAQYYRLKYGGVGYVWQDRFKSFVIQDGIYLLECGRYVELNPVRAEVVEKPERYKWSSCKVYVLGQYDNIVDYDPEFLGLANDKERCRVLYIEFLNDGLNERRGLDRYFKSGAYGDKSFIERLKNEGLKQTTWRVGRPPKR